mmetsp:Transcript_15402/g.31209  ORF Transcript_15402/g.31209 Transcript_15402/m.31209 type:complete len:100 (+) Transcript_15402:1097-1396(+)
MSTRQILVVDAPMFYAFSLVGPISAAPTEPVGNCSSSLALRIDIGRKWSRHWAKPSWQIGFEFPERSYTGGVWGNTKHDLVDSCWFLSVSVTLFQLADL